MAKKCAHIKDDGTRCGQNVSEGQDLCVWHDPDRKDEARAIRERAGKSSAKQRRLASGIDANSLPPLQSPQHAEKWLEVVGRAVASGRLSANSAQATIRAVREWLRARESGEVSERLDELMDALGEWKRTGDPDPVLKLVKGGKS